MDETAREDHALSYSPWGAAWVCLAPLGVWLVVTKALKVGYTAAVWLGNGPDFELHGALAPVYWILAFGWTRFALALAAAFVFRRVLGATRHFGLTVGVFFVTLLVLAILRARSGHDPLLQVLEVWCTKSFGEV